MKLSIITINLNNVEGLRKTIQSVVGQSFRDFEWIVVDGGSTDGSKELLESHAEHISKWVSEPDHGIYNAMNKGIRMAHGEYLLFLNSGDSLMDGHVLEKSVPVLSGTDYVIGNIHHSQYGEQGILHEESFKPGIILFLLMNYSLPHPACFMKKSLFDEYGGYREDFSIISDWVFMVESILLGKATLKHLPVMVTLFDDSGISSVNLQKGMRERERFMKERPVLLVIRDLLHFHTDNYDMVDTLKNDKCAFGLFRLFYYLKRKFRKKPAKSLLAKYDYGN